MRRPPLPARAAHGPAAAAPARLGPVPDGLGLAPGPAPVHEASIPAITTMPATPATRPRVTPCGRP